jgi:hypothetical protein
LRARNTVRAVVILGQRRAVGVGEALQHLGVVGLDPARGVERRALEVGADVVLGADAVGQHVELQRARPRRR